MVYDLAGALDDPARLDSYGDVLDMRGGAFPRYVLYYTGLRQAGIAEGPDIDAFSAGPA
jgi:hypothetical protein